MSLTVGDIKTRVKRQFGDEAGAQITDDDILRWANDGQLDIVRRTKVLQGKGSIARSADSYPMVDGTHLYVNAVGTSGRILRPTVVDKLGRLYPGYTLDKTGVPEWYYVWDREIYIFPDDVSVASIEVYYVKPPAALILDTDVPEIPEDMHEDIVRYCLVRARELDSDTEDAILTTQDYYERLSNQKTPTFTGIEDAQELTIGQLLERASRNSG